MATTCVYEEDDYEYDDENDEDMEYAPRAKLGKASRVVQSVKKTKPNSKNGSTKKKPSSRARSALAEKTNRIDEEEDEYDGNDGDVGGDGASGADGKTIEQTYQKLSQLEHILLRPDTYVGSIERQQQNVWILKEEEEDRSDAMDCNDCSPPSLSFEHKAIEFVPGLYKIFDEILVNACDHSVRDSSMDTLRVDFDKENGTIRVFNNGKGIPVEMHKAEGVHVPELIFGHLLTSSNYDDGEKKLTGGRNGYGSKLTNIFSSEFVIETCDGKGSQKRYRQRFSNNMKEIGKPEITKCLKRDNWTCVSFKPDLEKFGLESLAETETMLLMKKRVVDAAGCLAKRKVKVYLNDRQLPIKNFQDYVNLYIGKPGAEGALPRVYEKVNDRWEVCASVATEGQFNQVSFVNSICTLKGGTHANLVADSLAKKLLGTKTLKKHKKLKPAHVKSHIWVFVNAMIENPSFDSQTKEFLTLKASAFGSKCDLSDTFMKKFEKSGVVDNILEWANFKENKQLKKQDGSKKTRLTGIPKLDDANDAGGRNSQHCTLILTEGDSAKALAVSGLSVVGRDRYGVFPLRGKLLNVRDASTQQVMNNAEITYLKQILGLQHGKKYEDTKSLRYGHLMIMTDQDHDGSHIKGLVINFMHHFFPSLVKMPGFMVEFVTPIVKATRNNGKDVKVFYTLPEYESWKEASANEKGWKIKYYKGLGTSTAKEAKEYFADLQKNSKDFTYTCDEDGKLIEMVFSKKHVDDRKRWLNSFQPGTFLDHNCSEIPYKDFINKELILFSRADLERSIPCILDGFKPGQRKIMYCGFKRNLKSDIKVAQFAGYVSEHSAYHHGEQSLASTIVGLAQDYVGSNNVNLLFPSGQFGTRLQGGKDSASPRYIYTRLGPLARYLFREEDDRLLNYLDEDGQSIEPEWYLPVLPLVLLNGADGIGTGWSTSIPNYNPKDVAANVKRYISGMPMESMVPWYKGFEGEISRVITKGASADKGESFSVSGIINIIDEKTIEIVELPLRKWTQDYKDFLEALMKPVKKEQQPFITDYKEYHTDTSVHFVVTLPEKNLELAQKQGIYKTFKLLTTISTSNMHLFSSEGLIKRYTAPEEIIEEFCDKRLEFYQKRKDCMLQDEEEQMKRLDNKVRFILMVVNGELVISNRKKADIESDLDNLGFDRLTKGGKSKASKQNQENDEDDEASPKSSKAGAKVSYDYLLSMPLWSLSLEKVQDLQNEYDQKKEAVQKIRGTKPTDMWLDDIEQLEENLDVVAAEEKKLQEELAEQQQRAKGGKGKGKAKGKSAKAAPKKLAVGVKVAPPVIEAKAPSKRGKAAAPKKRITQVDSDSEDDFMPSLMERLASRSGAGDIDVAKVPAAKAPAKRKQMSKKESLDSPSPQQKTKTVRRVSPVKKKTAAKKKSIVLSETEESDSEFENDSEFDSDALCDDESESDSDFEM
ncbi:DNA topoisomerase II [Chloropicon primus]|uniref:DNA topoisomerase 2 n=3 Tax=Chloropicon primus TaxID=1764295 RepID=A0A5B8MZA7_9CHLO|nr:DNA topoisomerase II [Chloropicon primus]|eukprot:QDZ25819.1 DNA topoisomerase II [Chloropicon primus]